MSVSFNADDLSVSFMNKCVTPQDTNEPCAPAAASTVARPFKSTCNKAASIPEWKLDESAIPRSSFPSVECRPSNDTSLGLLPLEVLQHSSNPSQAGTFVWDNLNLREVCGTSSTTFPEQREDDGLARGSTPASLDRSTDTVVRNPEVAGTTNSPFARLEDLPEEDGTQTTLEQTRPSLLTKVLPEKYLLPTPAAVHEDDVNGTRDERFSDFSNPPGSHMSSSSSDHHEAEFDFSDAPPQNFDETFCNQAFADKIASNVSFIDAEEKENHEKFVFVQEERMVDVSARHSDASHLDRAPTDIFEYLRSGTSNLGRSLDDEASLSWGSSATGRERPTFGFDGIHSPKHKPVAAISPAVSMDLNEDVAVVDQKVNDWSYVAQSDPGSEAAEETLEQTVRGTLLQESGVSVDVELVAKVIGEAPAGRSPKYYAELVLAVVRKKRRGNGVAVVVDVTVNHLPSFLESDEDEATKENDDKGNGGRKPPPPNLRHSSPIKSRPPPPPSLPPVKQPKFPLQSDRASVHWFGVQPFRSEDQFFVLKNSDDASSLGVRLIIRDSTAFRFKENWAEGGPSGILDVKLPPGGKRDVFVTFTPTRAGLETGKMVLKPQSARGRTTAALKATLPLIGHGGSAEVRLLQTSGRRFKSEQSFAVQGSTFGLVAENRGTDVGFVKILAFSDPDLRVREPNVHIDHSLFTLQPNRRFAVNVKRNSNVEKVHLVLFKGCDVLRRVFCAAARLGTKKEELVLHSLKVGGEDFNIPQESLPPEICNHITAKDASHFYDKVERITMTLTFNRLSTDFIRLQAEETFNESSPSEPRLAVKRQAVDLDREEIRFPAVRRGESSMVKLSIRNRKNAPVAYVVDGVELPFKVFHHQLTVKPKHYTSFPIAYSPDLKGDPGPRECILRLTSESGPILVAKLVGTTKVM